MVSLDKRRAIFDLKAQNKGSRAIAKAVGVARSTVQQIIDEGPEPPEKEPRAHKLDPMRDRIEHLYIQCDRNLVRVAEELEKETGGLLVAYSTFTAYCRQLQLGQPREGDQPAGQYIFGPGVEMQHDTSLVVILVGDRRREYQATSLKLGYSKNRYLRFYRRFRRFECKDFHNRGLEFFEGACERNVVDNTSVVILCGTGKNALVVPEMETFGARYGFKFVAHEKGDSNRKAKVERDFDYIQGNFLKGRTFTDDADLNRQAEEWCRKKNMGFDKRRRLWLPRLFAEERAHLKRLPPYRPPECQWYHHRRVDAEGMVSLDGNRYSAPNEYLRKEVTIKETMDTITLMDGPKELCVHPRLPDRDRKESRLPGHGRDLSRRRRASLETTSEEERWLHAQSPILSRYIQGLRRLGGRRFPYQVRKLYGLCHEYEVTEVEKACEHAASYGLFDVTRLEGVLLQEHGARLFGFKRQGGGDGEGSVTPTVDAVERKPPPCEESAPKKVADGADSPRGGDDDGIA